ncbi:GTP-binding protein 2-like [Anneissia japonica]|uniref:GTP-binding protein 2-like n=1 Tax=Anneissia japonica TaxID=1529436 RepID=UPI001425A0D8|nr:GTP-binding protein 2-like [Anneissia japonica]
MEVNKLDSKGKSVDRMENLPPEVEEGNIEYKLKLINPSACRFEHLVTQMKWRLREGHGEAIYEIGVEDSGLLAGLNDADLQASLHTLRKMAHKLGATINILRQRVVNDCQFEKKTACEVLVRKVPDDQPFIDLKLAVLGNVDGGKSTLLGVLTQGELDNGRGRARLNLFRHLHEIQSGRTSSISHEILGFNSEGEVITSSDTQQGCLAVEEICSNASKLITLIDLAGHQKYIKTTICGLTGYSPDFAMLVISANTGIAGTTKEHLGVAMALQVPIFVVVTKIDMCSSSMLLRCMTQLHRLLTGLGCKKVPYDVQCIDDAVNAALHFNHGSICPIFQVSSVTGENLDMLKKFLHVVPPLHTTHEQEKLIQEHAEFQIDEVFSVPHVGTVVGGALLRGIVREHDELLLGPSENGEFKPVEITSIHRNRSPCRIVRPSQAASLSLKEIDRAVLRKGLVLLKAELEPFACKDFEAEILLLYHTTTISCGFQATIHVSNVCQTATIVHMDKESLKTNEKATVRLHFIKHPEYLRVGSRLFLREGRTKGMGQVTRVIPYQHTDVAER